MISFREAKESDAATVQLLVNLHESAVDPEASSMGDSGIAELMSGYIDNSPSYLMIDDSVDEPVGFIQLHPDKNRNLFFPDVYCNPKVANLASTTDQAVSWVIAQTHALEPTWSVRPGVNSKDDLLRSVYEAKGFEKLRTYWMLSLPLDSGNHHSIADQDLTFTKITDQNLDLVFALHQDAFSSHFGFKPRAKADWIQLERETQTREPEGSVILEVGGKPVGFLLSASELVHENGGFVDSIGVIQSAQGNGYGKVLLKWAIDYNTRLGRKKLDLNVDSGNESGALRLYESLGFRPVSAWFQLQLIRE